MAKTKKVTIHDIAQRLNITASTVSRSLNDNPRISDRTKKRVLSMAKSLNYKPNNVASALRNGKTQIIGMLVPLVDRAFFSSIIRGVEQVAEGVNYHVIVSQSYENMEKEKKAITAFLNAQVDGIVVSVSKTTTDFTHLLDVLKSDIPLILFDRTTNELATSQVIIDDYQGGYMATSHLIEQGCGRIVYLMPYQNLIIYKERYRGYLDALRDHGISSDERLVLTGNSGLEDGRKHAESLLKNNIQFDAIFSASDYCALGAMQVLKENNIRIPEDVAIVGFSNEPFTSFTEPSISTVDQHPLEMGSTVANLFFDALDSFKDIVPKKTVIQPKLIVRKSSDKS